MNNSGRVLTTAIRMKSSPSPRFDSRITGRRPKWSESAPCTGENTNCISMNAVMNKPCHTVARGISLLTKPAIRCGKPGMISPKASMSSITVMKMKTSAALRGPRAEARAESDIGLTKRLFPSPLAGEGQGWGDDLREGRLAQHHSPLNSAPCHR